MTRRLCSQVEFVTQNEGEKSNDVVVSKWKASVSIWKDLWY